MSSRGRASVYYDCSRLSDMLLLEDVRVTEQAVSDGFSRIVIEINDDQIVDTLLAGLTSLKQEREYHAAKQRLQAANAADEHARSLLGANRDQWQVLDDNRRKTNHERVEAERALAALKGEA